MEAPFKPVPVAVCERIRGHVDNLQAASSHSEIVAALFLAHCELKEIEAALPLTTTHHDEV